MSDRERPRNILHMCTYLNRVLPPPQTLVIPGPLEQRLESDTSAVDGKMSLYPGIMSTLKYPKQVDTVRRNAVSLRGQLSPSSLCFCPPYVSAPQRLYPALVYGLRVPNVS